MEDRSANRILVSVRNLVEFILRSGDIDNRKKSGPDITSMLEGAKIHRMIQAKMGIEYHPEVMLKTTIPGNEYDIVIEGRADGIIYNDDTLKEYADICSVDNIPVTLNDNRPTIDEIKCTYLDLDKLKQPVAVHLAQAKCYAYMFANMYSLREISVRMTYCNISTQELKYFHETYTFVEIRNWFFELIDSYKRWADFEFGWKRLRNETIRAVDFPFQYREGQKELVTQVYQTIYHGRKLFLEAPTGVGKTVSTIFPTVKAFGENLCDKMFYLTAKTITRTVAADCFDILRSGNLRMKTVVITAKEKICPLEKPDCNPIGCAMAKGHFDRVNDAIYDLLMSEDSFTPAKITEYAMKHNVCPFEMSLDLSLFCDGIICDYNYVFDPNVYLRRFFGDCVLGRYVFLVDEAHNLVDRGIDMYSATLYKEKFLEIKHLIKETDPRLDRALGGCNRKLLAMKRECENVLVLPDISEFVMMLGRALSRLETFLDEQEHFAAKDELLEFYFDIRHFMNMYDNMGEEDYRIYCEHTFNGDFYIKLLCVNPSESLKRRLDKAQSTVFFSATLLPVNYYKDMLGANEDDYSVYAKSIFDDKKRGLFIARDVSSKYTRRNETEYYNIACYINKIINARSGNYMVFFPSHAFLGEVLKSYESEFASDNVEILVQKVNMNENEREDFLRRFDDEPGLYDVKSGSALVGFCVMGGIFSEGIDLKKDSLIGAVIVGTGLPMVCNEREILKNSYDSLGVNGFDYAYRFPGMNKVLQAAGRVIRTEEDVGIVALLDERFLTPSYTKLFPREWKNYETCTLNNISEKLEEFWGLFEDNDLYI